MCTVRISIHTLVLLWVELTKMNASEGKVQPHWSLAAMLSSSISVSAATSKLLVALPVSSHECSMAVLHFSTSPPWFLLMLSRKGKSIPTARPSSCQSVRPRRLFLIANRCEVSRKARDSNNSH